MESGTQHNGLPDWRVYARQAEDYERQKRWEDAIPIRIAARDSALQLLGEDDEQVLNLTKELAQLYVQLGHFMEALPLLHAFLKQRERKGSFESKNVWAVLQQLGQIYIRLQRPAVAVDFLLRAYHLSGKLFEKHDANVGIISVTLGRSVLSLCRSKKCTHEDLAVALEAVASAVEIAIRRPEEKLAKSLPKIYLLLADLAVFANDRVREGEALVAAIRLLKAANHDATQLEHRLRRLQQCGDTLRRTLVREEICVSDFSMSEEELDDERTIHIVDFDEAVVSSGIQSDFTARSYSENGSDTSARKSLSCPITPRGRTPQTQGLPSPLSISATHSLLLDASSVETTSLPVSPLVTRANDRLGHSARSRSNSVSDEQMRGGFNPFAPSSLVQSLNVTPERVASNCASPISMRGPLGVRHRHSDPTLRLRAEAYQRSRSCDVATGLVGGAVSPMEAANETDHEAPSPRRIQERRGSLTLMPPLREADPATAALLQPLETRIALLEGRPTALDTCSEADLLSLLSLHQQALQATQAALSRLREKASSSTPAPAPKCSHCHDRAVELCLKPCNHACMCRSCCANAQNCPLCATPIDSWLAVSFT